MTRKSDWNPETYSRFHDLRLRPALDLMGRVGQLPDGPVMDLGCGNGAAGPALADRFGPARKVIGLDASPNMLDAARGTACYDDLIAGDVAQWSPEERFALIFSNAALHWLPDHAGLFRRLAGFLVPGGVLAVQMPRQHGAPSHRFLRDFASEMFPDRFSLADWVAPVLTPVEYHRLLSPLGGVDVWETEYVHRLAPAKSGHPVRRFTESTAMRPYLDKLSGREADDFVHRYEQALASAYPAEVDGSVLFPIRRIFVTLAV